MVDAVASKPSAQRIARAGGFVLPCDAEKAFPLFSPEGEREWVKGWDPKPIFPSTIEFRRDTVFQTQDAAGEAIWIILAVEWKSHTAEYVRIAPHSHSAHIVVKIEPLSTKQSKVDVTYTVTAFGETTANLLAELSEDAYVKKMLDWQQRIIKHLESGMPLKKRRRSVNRIDP
jgi:hypothetical protein